VTPLEQKLAALCALAGADGGTGGRLAQDDSHQVTIVVRNADCRAVWEVIVGDKSGDGYTLEAAVNEAIETMVRVTRGKVCRLQDASLKLLALQAEVKP
jgi:hypothetical protein